MYRIATIVTALFVALATPAHAQQVTTPDQHLGRPLGADFDLADWAQVSSYYKLLAQQSPNVLTLPVGTSTEGREFLLSIISSPQNLANLDQIKNYAATIADPRGRTDAQLKEAVNNGKVILFISCAMHSTETAAPQFGMQFAYTLATSDEEPWVSARDNMVVGIFPTLNPDGLDEVVSWYRQNVGTPLETSGLSRLYQKYAGHDNNRDWFMLSLDETRIVTRLLYHEWFPTVYWDVHQQGSGGERMFIPPFRDPLNPNLDPAIMSAIDALSSRALLDMTRQGLTGVATGISYDMWWNGGNRNVPVRHNIIGLLTEAASVRIATPIFQRITDLSNPITKEAGYVPSNQHPAPWPGGWWRLRDIIDYELAFGRSLVGSLGREPRVWIENKLQAGQRSIDAGLTDAPRAWILPSDNPDPVAVRRLVDSLMLAGVDVQVSNTPVVADARTYPAGSIVIRRDQPYGRYVKDLFEIQQYPKGAAPYDVAGWSLPLLMGVRQIEVARELDAELTRAGSPDDAIARFAPAPGPTENWPLQRSDTWTRLVQGLKQGQSFLNVGDSVRQVNVSGSSSRVIDSIPRIGLYSPWSGNMDEGWTRWLFDEFNIPYVTVRNESLRAGDLSSFIDVLVIPSVRAGQLDRGRAPGSAPQPLVGGLEPAGSLAIEQFVRQGGTLVTIGSSTQWAIDALELPLVDVTREEDAKEFSCPGSVLRAVPTEHFFASGLDDSLPLFFSRSNALRPMSTEEREQAAIDESVKIDPLLLYAPNNLLLSGWIQSPDVIEGKIAWTRARYGDGSVHLFAFRPQYRSWTHGTFQLLFRAIFLND